MTKKIKTTLTIACVILGICATANAQTNAPPAYSARAIHAVPGLPETSGTVIKSGQNMRLEFERGGQKVIQILLPTLGAMYILDPNTQTYFEILGPAVPVETADNQKSPCPAASQAVLCQQVGTATVSGIQVERWALTSQQQAKPVYILWDSTRARALQQESPDGSTMTMAFKAMETLAGRPTEHWGILVSIPGQEAKTGDWWFDPELRITVRENLPGGETRRLENIKVGPVDPAAFQVPAGWKKQEAPAIAPPVVPQNSATNNQ